MQLTAEEEGDSSFLLLGRPRGRVPTCLGDWILLAIGLMIVASTFVGSGLGLGLSCLSRLTGEISLNKNAISVDGTC